MDRRRLTTSGGIPVADNQSSLTAGLRKGRPEGAVI
jgi:hypothetical protein